MKEKLAWQFIFQHQIKTCFWRNTLQFSGIEMEPHLVLFVEIE